MTTYTVDIPDDREPCITAARMAYNESIPMEVWDETANEGAGGMVPNPDLKADNAAYMAWVMENATKSYCRQYFPNWPEGTPLPTPAPSPPPAAATRG